jgi:hypothetical protein
MENNTIAGKLPKQNVLLKIVSFSWLKRSVDVEVICFLFIFLFMYAAVSKLLDYEKFKIELGKTPLLTNIAGCIAIGIPLIEIVISLMLAKSGLRLYGLYASFSLMVMFTAYLIAILQFSFYIPCTCGGVLQKLNWDAHIVFNSVFIILAVIGILSHRISKT